jgi:hypothetical protein
MRQFPRFGYQRSLGVQHINNTRQYMPAGLAQFNAARGADKKPHAKFFLKLGYAVRERWLRHATSLRRVHKRPKLRQSPHISQLLQVHPTHSTY